MEIVHFNEENQRMPVVERRLTGVDPGLVWCSGIPESGMIEPFRERERGSFIK